MAQGRAPDPSWSSPSARSLETKQAVASCNLQLRLGAAPPLPIANKSLTSAGPARHHNEGSNWTAIPVEIIKSSLKMKLWGRVHMKQILALKSLQYILYFS